MLTGRQFWQSKAPSLPHDKHSVGAINSINCCIITADSPHEQLFYHLSTHRFYLWFLHFQIRFGYNREKRETKGNLWVRCKAHKNGGEHGGQAKCWWRRRHL